MFRKIILILTGNAFGSLMLLVRNLAVARLISIEDYGIAATFAISMAVVEMASGIGLQQLIIQDKNRDDPQFQAGLQGFNMLRGFGAGLALFLLAQPIANFLGIPDVAWAYEAMALVPILRGFEHFDIHRLNRNMQFGPLIISKTVPALFSVLSIWPLHLAFGDYRVMLYSVLLHWALTILSTHFVAKRRYRMNFHGATIRKSLNFGWPLLVNNILLFAVFQGDKLLVGRELGMTALAIFSMGVTFTLTPTLVTASSERQFFFPQLSHAKDSPEHFGPLARAAMQASLVTGLILVLSVTLLAEPLVTLLLGEKYDPLVYLLPWMAVWQATRAFKVGNTIVGLSQALTSNAMIANSVRSLALPAAWIALTNGGSQLHVICIATAGELGAYFTSLALITTRLKLNTRPLILPFAATLLTMALSVLQTTYLPAIGFHKYLIWAGITGMAIGSLMLMRDLRAYIVALK